MRGEHTHPAHSRSSSPNPYRNAMLEFRARREFPLPAAVAAHRWRWRQRSQFNLFNGCPATARFIHFLHAIFFLLSYFVIIISLSQFPIKRPSAFFWSTPFTFFVLRPPRTAIFKTQKVMQKFDATFEIFFTAIFDDLDRRVREMLVRRRSQPSAAARNQFLSAHT